MSDGLLRAPISSKQASPVTSGELLSLRHEAVLSSSATLTDLLAEYAVFSHALWFTYGGLDVDPIDDFMSTRSCSAPLRMGLPAPLFRGMGEWQGLELDYAIWLCPLDVWPELRTFLRMVGAIHPQHTWQASCQEPIAILDVLHELRYPDRPVPRVPAMIFGVDGTLGQVAVQPGLTGSVPVVRRPARPDTVAVMRASQSGDTRAHELAQPSFDEAVTAMQEKLRADQAIPPSADGGQGVAGQS